MYTNRILVSFALAMVLASLLSFPVCAEITYEVHIDFPQANAVIYDIDIPVRGVIKRVGFGQNKPGVPFIPVEATVDGVTKTTYTDESGNYEFRFEPDLGGIYSITVTAFNGQYQATVDGIEPRARMGGAYDSRELYYDVARLNLLKSSMVLYPDQLKYTMARITIPDSTFNWKAGDPPRRQFPEPEGDTFPWTIGDPGDLTAMSNNSAANDLNDEFFNRLQKFCQHFNDAGIKVILTVFDPNYFTHHDRDEAFLNDPWAKLAFKNDMNYDSVFHVLPGQQNAVSIAMEAFLDKLAETLYPLGHDVYVEFNNETIELHGSGDPTPSDDWLKKWQNYFFVKLRDEESGVHSTVSVHLMVNAQNGDVETNSVNDYTNDCWCVHGPVDDLEDVLIRNFYVSGHDLRDDPSDILFELCQFTPFVCDGFAGSNQRAYFFTEGKIGAGGDGYDDWVATALMNGYQVALGANQDYRNLAPDWGSGATTAFTCNYINVGIKNAVVAAQAQQ